jgi:hypothetical protein
VISPFARLYCAIHSCFACDFAFVIPAADGLSLFGSACQLAYRELHRSSTN